MKEEKNQENKENEAEERPQPAVEQDSPQTAETTDASVIPSAADWKVLQDKAAQADENRDKYLRAVAELDNYRKRAVKDRAAAVEYAETGLIHAILPIIDNLERALAQLKGQADAKALQEGLALISRQTQTFLDSIGLKPITCAGQMFDPHLHEAVLHVTSAEHPDQAVLEEVQKGYTLNGRVIRHALVKVVNNPQEQEPKK